MAPPKRIRVGGLVYVKKVANPYGSPASAPGSRQQATRQKTLVPRVVREMPSNPDPLFDKATQYLEKIGKLLEGLDLDDKDLDLALLVKRYNLPSLQILRARWMAFRKDFDSGVKVAQKEIQKARGADKNQP